MDSKKFSFSSRIRSFRHAFNGLKLLLKYEHNSRIHLFATVASVTLGIILKINKFEWALLAMVIGIVFLSELFNSAIERLGDVGSHEWNKKIMQAKDFAAAAVLISAIIALVIGGIIFLPKIF